MNTNISKLFGLVLFALFFAATPTYAAIITFDTLVSGATSFGYDGDGDGINDVIFSTTDPAGFNTAGPGANMTFIQEPGLEGTSTINPDLRVDFLHGATDTLSFGFALDSFIEDPSFFASINVFAADNILLATATEVGKFTTTSAGTSNFPEGEIITSFSGVAQYATFDFTSQVGRYIIDNFEGTFGSTEVPAPATLLLLGLGLFGMGLVSRKKHQ